MALDDETEPQLVDLREFLGVISRRRMTVAAVVVTVVGLAIAMVYQRTPVYTATARVEVRPLTSNPLYAGAFYDLQSAMDTEAARIASEQIVSGATAILGTPTTGSVNATVPANTALIDIACTDPSPDAARACADAFAQAYVEDRRATAMAGYDAATEPYTDEIRRANDELERLEIGLAAATSEVERATLLGEIASVRSERETAQLQLLAVPAASPTPGLVVGPAQTPAAPSNKGYVTTGFLAMIVGLAFGIGLAFVRERLDERLPDRQGFEQALGAPVISVVPKVPGWRDRSDAKVVSLSAPDSAAAEAYRAARTTLLYLAREGGLKVIAVTGPGQAEGKTTTTVNLAVSLAQAGTRVVAISADLRRPRLHRFFHLDNTIGTSSVLSGRGDLVAALHRTDVSNLIVMPSGPVPANPAELLASEAMDDLLAELRSLADIVLIDTAPSLVVSDMLGLAPKTDGVLVVADAASTHRSAVLQVRSQLERVGGQIVGGVLNNLDPASGRRGTYSSYGYRDDYREATGNEATNGHGGRAGNGHARGAHVQVTGRSGPKG